MVPGVRKRSSKDVRASKANGRRGHRRVGEVFWKQPLKYENAELSLSKPRTTASPPTPDAGANITVLMKEWESSRSKAHRFGGANDG